MSSAVMVHLRTLYTSLKSEQLGPFKDLVTCLVNLGQIPASSEGSYFIDIEFTLKSSYFHLDLLVDYKTDLLVINCCLFY